MNVAADLQRGARAVERLVRRMPISRETADDARAALRLAAVARALLVEVDVLQRRIARLQHIVRPRRVRRTLRPPVSEPRSYLAPLGR
jgi:hypothetical protein